MDLSRGLIHFFALHEPYFPTTPQNRGGTDLGRRTVSGKSIFGFGHGITRAAADGFFWVGPSRSLKTRPLGYRRANRLVYA